MWRLTNASTPVDAELTSSFVLHLRETLHSRHLRIAPNRWTPDVRGRTRSPDGKRQGNGHRKGFKLGRADAILPMSPLTACPTRARALWGADSPLDTRP